MSSPDDVVKLQDPKTLFVVTIKGQLRVLYLPVRVKCIGKVEQIPAGARVYIEAVFMNKKHLMVYWIGGRLYEYHYFLLDIQ